MWLPTFACGAETISLERILRPLQQLPEAQQSAPEPASHVAETTPKLQVIDSVALLDKLEEDLQDVLEAGDSLELTLRANWVPLRLPSSAEWSVYTPDNFTADSRGFWVPRVVLLVDGQVQDEWRLPLQASLFRAVHMTKRRLNKGDLIDETLVQSVTCDIYEKRTLPVPASADLAGYEMSRTLGQGQLLSWGDLIRRPDIRKGQTVEVLLKNGNLSIRMEALSLQDAVVGESITLRNPRSREEFSAVVASSKQARVIQ